jgi:hypothetical protein
MCLWYFAILALTEASLLYKGFRGLSFPRYLPRGEVSSASSDARLSTLHADSQVDDNVMINATTSDKVMINPTTSDKVMKFTGTDKVMINATTAINATTSNSEELPPLFSPLEHKGEVPSDELKQRNKIVLVLIETFYGSWFGVDRMYLCQFNLGLMKMGIGLFAILVNQFFGGSFPAMLGLVIWFLVGLVDWVVVMLNCLQAKHGLHEFGFDVVFTHLQVEIAFWIALVGIALSTILPCWKGLLFSSIQNSEGHQPQHAASKSISVVLP